MFYIKNATIMNHFLRNIERLKIKHGTKDYSTNKNRWQTREMTWHTPLYGWWQCWFLTTTIPRRRIQRQQRNSLLTRPKPHGPGRSRCDVKHGMYLFYNLGKWPHATAVSDFTFKKAIKLCFSFSILHTTNIQNTTISIKTFRISSVALPQIY